MSSVAASGKKYTQITRLCGWYSCTAFVSSRSSYKRPVMFFPNPLPVASRKFPPFKVSATWSPATRLDTATSTRFPLPRVPAAVTNSARSPDGVGNTWNFLKARLSLSAFASITAHASANDLLQFFFRVWVSSSDGRGPALANAVSIPSSG